MQKNERALNSAVVIQKYYRRFRDGRAGRQHMRAQRQTERLRWRLRQQQDPIRQGYLYRCQNVLGLAPTLESDTFEEKVRS
jgi:hypothetical protein